jgi:hypothetical protein
LRRELPSVQELDSAVLSKSKCSGVKVSTPPALARAFAKAFHQEVSRCTTAVQLLNRQTKSFQTKIND